MVKFFGLMRKRVQTNPLAIEGAGLTILELLRAAEEKTGQPFLDEMVDKK